MFLDINVNPTTEMIDSHVDDTDSVVFFNNIKDLKEFKKVLIDTLNHEKNTIVYVHFYTKDKTYSVGLKRRD